MPHLMLADRFGSVAADLSDHGHAILDGCDMATVEAVAGKLGIVTTSWQALTPRPEATADPWSLSGRYGLGQFPWHTDGAVATKPPRFLVLYCVAAVGRTEPTELLDFAQESNLKTAQLLSRVVLKVRGREGNIRYLPAFQRSNGNPVLRWDPRTCEVARPEWTSVADIIDATLPTTKVQWHPGRAAFIDNRRNLHRRPRVSATDIRVLKRLYIY